jgi:hypothetical protein
MNPRSMFFVALVAAVMAGASAAGFAQDLDVSGQWRVQRPFGVFDVAVTQNGAAVEGTYHLGKLQGMLDGNVLTGSYSDIMSSGQVFLTFSADGNSFAGSAGAEEWTGTRVGTLATTPQGILRSRARLDEVQSSGQPYEAQAVTACENLFLATYAGGGELWTTAKAAQPGSFAPVLGADPQTVYVQVRDVRITGARSETLSPADEANGWQYKGSVNFTAVIFRLGTAAGWREWRDVPGGSFILCFYQVRNGAAAIEAMDALTATPLERLDPPTSIPPG